ncbi:calcium-binding protein [Nonomuraea sp. NPDC002799]
MRKILAVAALAAAAIGLQTMFAVPSHADTLTNVTLGNLNVSAAAGKANNITISINGSGQVVINDTADAVRAGAGCTQINANTVECAGVNLVRVFAGDLADTVTNNSPVSSHQHGDAGADTLRGGSGTDQFFGGVGNDTTAGNGGNDIYNADLPVDGADVFAGGPGVDTAAYNNRTAALTITLNGVANDGAAGEGDNLMSDVENVFAGSGSDVVTGNGVANEIRAGQGADTITGLGGNDTLNAVDGAGGNDSLNAGTGTDTCFSDAGDTETGCEI